MPQNIGLGLPGAYGAAAGGDAVEKMLMSLIEQQIKEQEKAAKEEEKRYRRRQDEIERSDRQEQERYNREQEKSAADIAASERRRGVNREGVADLERQGVIITKQQQAKALEEALAGLPEGPGKRRAMLRTMGGEVDANEAETPEERGARLDAEDARSLRKVTAEAEARARAEAKYRPAGKDPTAPGGPLGLQRVRAQSALDLLTRLETRYEELQGGEGPGQIVKGIATATGGRINLNNAATEYQKLRKAAGVALAVAIQGARPSDVEAEALGSLFPDFTTPKKVGDNLFSGARQQLEEIVKQTGGTVTRPNQTKTTGARGTEYDYVPGKGLVKR